MKMRNIFVSILVLSWMGMACNSSNEANKADTDTAADIESDLRLTEVLETILDSFQPDEIDLSAPHETGTDDNFQDDQSEPKDAENGPVLVKLTPEDYTNEPVLVGQAGMGFQFDDIAGPVQVVKADDRCAVLHGSTGEVGVNTYKVKDGEKTLGLEGVKLVTQSYEFKVPEGELLYGNEQALQATTVALGFCQKVLVEDSNTLFEGDYVEGEGCKVPFIIDGTTYMAMLGDINGCSPYEIGKGAEAFLFARYDEDSGLTHVIVPVFVENGEVWSPCVPLGETSLSEFETELDGLL
jgi:hypothetical protein